ncbi:hypothetical protein ACJQWK_05558 [Exserohilum turcicum]
MLAVCVLPRALAIVIAARGRLPTWDTSNTHSSDVRAQLKQRMPAETYTMYERMTACYDGGMEVRLDQAGVQSSVVNHVSISRCSLERLSRATWLGCSTGTSTCLCRGSSLFVLRTW